MRGIPFEPGELAGALRRVLAMPEAERERLRRAAMARVKARYSWDAVTDAYEKLLKGNVRLSFCRAIANLRPMEMAR